MKDDIVRVTAFVNVESWIKFSKILNVPSEIQITIYIAFGKFVYFREANH